MRSAQRANADLIREQSTQLGHPRWLSPQCDPEIAYALNIIDAQSGGVIWAADSGMGKAEFLHRLAAELSPTPAAKSPRVIRFNASSFPSATTDITRNQHQMIDSAGSDTLVVMLVDNIDLVDANTRELIIELATGQSPRVVLFATAQENSVAARDYRPFEIRTLPAVTTAQTLELLTHGHQRETSPQVAAILNRSLCGIQLFILLLVSNNTIVKYRNNNCT